LQAGTAALPLSISFLLYSSVSFDFREGVVRVRWCAMGICRLEASASESGDSGLKRKQASASESEEDKILKLKSEEGKILKLKKEAMAANEEMSEATREELSLYMPVVRAAEPSGKKTKKVLVRKLVPMEEIYCLLAMPCPIKANHLTEEQLAEHPKRFQDWYHEEMNIAKKLRDYHQALIDQYSEYGYAVDESETEVTDDEDEDGDN